MGVEHLLGTGAEAAAAAGMAHHHHAHHAGAEHAQQDGGVAVAISAEQLLQLQEAQSLGFSPEQLQVGFFGREESGGWNRGFGRRR